MRWREKYARPIGLFGGYSSSLPFAFSLGVVLSLRSDAESSSPEYDFERGNHWLSSARLVSPARLQKLLEQYRPYLTSITDAELPQHLQTQLDSSILVQETLLRGFRQFRQFVGTTDAEFAAWLREILRDQIVDVTRQHSQTIREVRCERLPDMDSRDTAMPTSEAARRVEMSEQLRQAIAALPEHYRTVILLRQEQNLTFEEIGLRMQKNADAVRLLWGSAILQLAKLMQSDA
jgi:RNA polymerase sigma-70 factor (ECF subfamily)